MPLSDPDNPPDLSRSAPRETRLPAGSVVFREGDDSRDVYLALAGRMRVSCRIDGIERPVAEIRAPTVFGEMSLLDNQPRSATITVLEECRVVAIPPAAFLPVLREVPPWFRAVLKVVGRRLRDTNRRVSRSTVPDPLLAFCRFLSHQLPRAGAFSAPWLPLVDRLHLVSRLPREEIRRCAQAAIGRGLARIDQEQNLVVPDAERFREFEELQASRPQEAAR